MKKNNYSRCLLLVLISLALITFSFKDSVYSKSDTSGTPVESNPRGIAINPATDIAVVANEKADSVSILSLETQGVLSTISVGKAPRGVAIDKELNLAIIGNSKDNTISIIDLSLYSSFRLDRNLSEGLPTSGNDIRVRATIAVGKEPEGIAVNQLNHTAIVANHKDNTVSVIDLTTNSVIRTIPIGQEPKDVAIAPELNLALVVNEKDYNVSVIDLNTYQVTGTVPVGQKPQAIDINPETHLAAVVNEKDNSITVINLLNWQTTVITVGKHPIAVAINQLDNRALVICDEDRTLLLIDLNTNIITKTYPLNKLPKGIAVNNLTNIAAITDDKTDSLTLIQLPNPVPEIISINPDTLLRGSNETMITVGGSGFTRSSSVSLLTPNPYTLTPVFTDNHNLQMTIPKDLLTNAGTFQITVTNPTPEGGISSPVNLQINNPIPSISMLDPIETKAGTQSLTLTIYGAGFFDDTEIYFGSTKKPITYISPTKLQLNLTHEDLKIAGQYEITAKNLPPGGGTSNKAVFTIKPSLEITITSPTDGETINKAKTIVKGTFKSETRDIGITINGILAEITGNDWIANNISLTIGANTITATIKDSEGNVETASITINTTDTTQPVTLSANITSGISPLNVFFSTSTSTFSPVLYKMDFEGDGIADYTGATFENITHTYTQEGIFYPTVTVTDEQGNAYSDTIAITVLSKTELDTLLKGKWEGMKGKLLNNDIEGTLTYFGQNISTQEKYRKVFEKLSNRLVEIINNMPNITLLEQQGNIAQYLIIRIEQGKEFGYYIYFVRETDRIWRISTW
ncbi:MAG: hypothetical protein FD156_656 [Nitrospirae bacterium]|nr:MAG: hypothetical protein FD156_656 [Nitrospirota bacterium]